jgi:hypothetical protein
VLLSVSVLGAIGKVGLPHSWLFRSRRYEEARVSEAADRIHIEVGEF